MVLAEAITPPKKQARQRDGRWVGLLLVSDMCVDDFRGFFSVAYGEGAQVKVKARRLGGSRSSELRKWCIFSFGSSRGIRSNRRTTGTRKATVPSSSSSSSTCMH